MPPVFHRPSHVPTVSFDGGSVCVIVQNDVTVLDFETSNSNFLFL